MAADRRIVFMGTSRFAALILSRLLDAGETVEAVYTRPDREAGRGMALKETDVKRIAGTCNLPVFQPENFRDSKTVQELADLKPDFLVVASYGLILPQKVLDVPAVAPVNIHASLLPAYRGAAPIQYAIKDSWLNDVTGVSIMKMEKGMDTGPVYATAELSIAGRDTKELTDALAELGADLLIKILPEISQGGIVPAPQNHDLATYTEKLTKTDGIINWNWPADRVHSLVRAVHGWPGAQTVLQIGGREYPVVLEPGQIGQAADQPPGTINVQKNKISIATADRWYELGKILPQGRKMMEATAFFNGLRCNRGNSGTAV